MEGDELLLLQETIKKSFRHDEQQGRLFWVTGENIGKDASFTSVQWATKRLVVRVCSDNPPKKKSKRWKVGVDTIIWWLGTREWVPDGIIHANQIFDDCRFANLRVGEPESPEKRSKDLFATIDRVFTYDHESGKLLWNTGVNKGAEAGFLSSKGGIAKKIVRVTIEQHRFAPFIDIRVDSIVWWLVNRQWFPDGLIHKRPSPNDCSIQNLAKPNSRRKSRA